MAKIETTKNKNNETSSSSISSTTVDRNLMGDYFIGRTGKMEKFYGYNWFMAALFVVADMIGGGIVALPNAIMTCSKYIYIFF